MGSLSKTNDTADLWRLPAFPGHDRCSSSVWKIDENLDRLLASGRCVHHPADKSTLDDFAGDRVIRIPDEESCEGDKNEGESNEIAQDKIENQQAGETLTLRGVHALFAFPCGDERAG